MSRSQNLLSSESSPTFAIASSFSPTADWILIGGPDASTRLLIKNFTQFRNPAFKNELLVRRRFKKRNSTSVSHVDMSDSSPTLKSLTATFKTSHYDGARGQLVYRFDETSF